MSNNYKIAPVTGQTCVQSGDTFDVPAGYLECRYIFGGKLVWMKINSVKNTFTNLLSPSGTEVCKLKNSDIDESKLPANTRGVFAIHLSQLVFQQYRVALGQTQELIRLSSWV